MREEEVVGVGVGGDGVHAQDDVPLVQRLELEILPVTTTVNIPPCVTHTSTRRRRRCRRSGTVIPSTARVSTSTG
jgi:hypothetical protein